MNDQSVIAVVETLMKDPSGRHWGFETWRASGIRPGLLYPILWKMLSQGWLTDGWEETQNGRPPRRYYEITEAGQLEMREMLKR